MKLTPIRPPGRCTRKARAFAAEIGQLRAQGYTFTAIRDALAEAGVQVRKSTVQREVSRLALLSRSAIPAAPACTRTPLASHVAVPAPCPAAPQAATVAAPVAATDRRSGKAIAEAFVRGRITHPLIRTRNTP